MTFVDQVKSATVRKEIEVLENSIEELRLAEPRDEISIRNLQKLLEAKRLALAEISADAVVYCPV